MPLCHAFMIKTFNLQIKGAVFTLEQSVVIVNHIPQSLHILFTDYFYSIHPHNVHHDV